jgi:undecaprenyl-diphosphatase
MYLGLSRSVIVEFSFLLAIPTMAGAAGLDILRSNWSFSFDEWVALFVGFIMSFLTALCVIKILLMYVQKHDFRIFGWYRILLGLICLFLLK